MTFTMRLSKLCLEVVLLLMIVINFKNASCEDSSWDSHTSDLIEVFETVDALLGKGKGDEAISALHTIVDADISDEEKRQKLIFFARIHVLQGNDNEAEQILKNIVREKPNHVGANFYLGKLYSRLKSWDLAEDHLKNVLSRDPENDQAYMLLGKLYVSRDKNSKAGEEMLQHAAMLKPLDATIRFELGMIQFFDDDNHLGARESLLVAESLNPNIDNKLLGRVYVHYKHFDWAAEEFQKVTKKCCLVTLWHR